MMSRIPHRPEEWQQMFADLPGVLAPHAGLQLVMRQPLPQDVRFEQPLAQAGVTPSTGADRRLGVLPGILGILLRPNVPADRSRPRMSR